MFDAIHHPSAPATLPGPARHRHPARELRRMLRALLHELAGAWRYAAARREFERVDDHTLRDLGITRGEFDSYWAETQGWVEPTRRRVTREIRGSSGV